MAPLPCHLAPGRYKRGAFALTVRGVLSPAEARALIDATEGRHEAAPLNGERGCRASRTAAACVVEDPDLAARLFERLRGCLPAAPGGRRPLGLAPRVSFFRYAAGDYFKPHRPAPAAAAGGDVLATCVVHLNDDFAGGRVVLFSAAAMHEVAPAAGDALLVSHDVTREAPAVRAGVKHVLCADVVYGPPGGGRPPRPPRPEKRAA